jgi:hypothetical protein
MAGPQFEVALRRVRDNALALCPFPRYPLQAFAMLDISFLRKDLAAAVALLERRKSPQPFLDVDCFSALEGERKAIQSRTEALQARRNALSKQIGQRKAWPTN